ncbi:MAG: protein translocase subunit SecF [Acidimicrobiales bacterium]|nr:protein translocase subunit SecF [Actinomycetota bacterium]
MTAPTTEAPERGVLKRLYHGETNADIVGRWKLWFSISGVILLIGIGTLATQGLNLGIDFTGGTVWQVEAGKAEVPEVQRAMADLGYADVQVQEVTQVADGRSTRFLRVEAEATAEPTAATTKALDAAESGLDDLVGEVPEGSRDDVAALRDNVASIDGPFQEDVPDELTALQREIDALPDALKAAKTDKAKAAAVDDAVTSMQGHVDALSDLEDAEITRVGQDVTKELARLTGTPANEVTVDTVGPSWGKQISDKARTALVVFLIAITIFITIRFELKMAIATVVALFHDLLLVVGIYALLGFPITPATVVALLTMLGFSIYDGIVVFDRVNENTKLLNAKSKMTYTEMANLSLNQVLMRSLNTSITSLLPILSVLVVGAFVLGASTLEEFGVALFLGLLSGAYSSIFIATPMLALLKEREPRYRDLRRQIEERGHGTVVEPDKPKATADPVMESVVGFGPGGTPRPRKPGRR